MPIKHEADEAYHSGEGVSKTTLWTLHSKTPFHARYGARKESHAFDLGKAAHIAILEPHRLESSVMRGPDDRRGNKWKEAQDEAAARGAILLTSGDYEQALLIRDLADTVPELQVMRKGEVFVETSAYHIDEETGALVKCRPDLYNKTHGLMLDVKNMTSASPMAFQKSVGEYGYHVQHAMYSDVWARGAEMTVDAFFFVVFEKSEPPVVAVYELSSTAVAEGYAIYRQALQRYSDCLKADDWPGYGTGVQRVDLRRWDYKLTEAPKGEDE
jgi:hypothetical protein